ncbi:MAG: TonB-dependent receptor [Amphiplicatus sp.]
MKAKKHLTSRAGRLFSGAAIGALAIGGAAAQPLSDDEIVVTAQRTEQSVQDVPIAVSAFGGNDLQKRQMETFSDIQFNIPNFQFTRTQFTASAVSIRGIGNFLVASSSEDTVSVHLNDMFLSTPRLFETEFFDVERLEILRGPQGTLFGRNATGGVINVITAKADPDAVEGYIDGEYGNYQSAKVQGALNVPLSDTLALRLAGITTQRDGYTKNLFDGSNIDDRDIYSIRASARWLATPNTTVDVTASHMREDDHRMRFQKQACEAGPLSPLLGCDPNGPRRFDQADLRATLLANTSVETFTELGGAAAGAAYGLVSLAGGPIYGAAQPTDMRVVAWDTTPQYDAEETILMANVKHDFESFALKLNGGWGKSSVATRMDFDGGLGPVLAVPSALGAPVALGGLPGPYALYADGLFPVSDFDTGLRGTAKTLVGVIGGNIQSRSNRYQAIDWSVGDREYWSIEGIAETDFDGPFNFLLGANHLKSSGYADFAVATTGLDYFSVVGGTLAAVGAAPNALAAAAAATQGYSFYVPYFYNDTEDDTLNSTSLFGEVYVDITDRLKLTGGVRHNWDTKAIRDRGNLLESAGLRAQELAIGLAPVVPLGAPSVRALLDSNELVTLIPSTTLSQGTSVVIGGVPLFGEVNDYRIAESDFDSTTGRAVLQWAATDNLLYYVSWTRGYKPGGFNPRTLTASVPLTFDPEVINAYEAGVKSNLAGGALQANLTGFYYDYSNLQVSKIVANTSINENINAMIWGLEGEFVWRPTNRWTFNMNASYLNTEIGEFSTIDVRDPTAGRTDVELIADITNGQNCIVTRGPSDPEIVGAFIPSPYSACGLGPRSDGLQDMVGLINMGYGTNYAVIDGVEQSLKGNQLLGAPEFKIAGGVEYAIPMGGRYELTPRVDAYYQSKMYTSNFNTEQDLVDGYGYINAQLRFTPTEGAWYLRFFMQNVTDSEAITGAFDSGQSVGNFQNLFILEPRRWGFGMGMTF